MSTLKAKRFPFNPGPAAWKELFADAKQYDHLDEKIIADWLIIGAGFAGLSAAKRLRELHPKDRIIVLEAQRVGDGPAGRNSGFMIDLPHNLASKDYAGALEKDKLQTEMNRAAINFAAHAADQYKMPPDAFEASGKINAAASAKGVIHNLDYAAHLHAMNEKHELLDASQMKSICGSDYYQSGLYTPGTAMLQPALYIGKFAEGLHRQSVTVYENSAVTKLAYQNSQWTASTAKGQVSAPKVIMATNGHVESFGLFKKRLMHIYLYASMTAPFSADEEAKMGGDKVWAFTPADPMGTTVRKISTSKGSSIIVRNRFTWSPSLNVDASKMKSIAKVHDRSFAQRFPKLANTKMDYRWGGLLCLSLNNVGAFGEVEDGLFSACCQNGLGTAQGTLSGILAAEQASGMQSKFLDHMLSQAQPQKLPPEPFSSIGANAYMRWGEFKAGKEL